MITYEPKVTNVYVRNFNSDKKIKVNRGGTRSSKTYSICQLLIRWLITGRISRNKVILTGVASIVRKTFPSLKASAMRDIIEILHEHDLYRHMRHHKTDHIIEFPGTGRMIEFFSADNQQKVRSRKRAILYCVEANELSYKDEFYQMLMRTTDNVFIDLNPDDPYIWINEEIEQNRASRKNDVEVIVSTYKDNPFISQEHVEEIEYMEEVDEELWEVYGLGQYGKVTGLVFPDITVVNELPAELSKTGRGLDFGFATDPAALIYGGVLNKYDLYLHEELYDWNLTNLDLVEEFKKIGIGKFSGIYADSSEPKSIEEIRRQRINIKPATKGQGSLLFGIKLLRRHKIHITASSLNLLKEQKKYKWREGKNEPIDAFNHGWDASRYYGMMKLATPRRRKKRTFKTFG